MERKFKKNLLGKEVLNLLETEESFSCLRDLIGKEKIPFKISVYQNFFHFHLGEIRITFKVVNLRKQIVQVTVYLQREQLFVRKVSGEIAKKAIESTEILEMTRDRNGDLIILSKSALSHIKRHLWLFQKIFKIKSEKELQDIVIQSIRQGKHFFEKGRKVYQVYFAGEKVRTVVGLNGWITTSYPIKAI